ncbi:tetratricopeptide repeat protein, partial [Burkholderia ubonensis]
MNDIHDTLQSALAHHQAGRLAEAKALYDAILTAQPGQPDALH